jgi:predicted phage tail protein
LRKRQLETEHPPHQSIDVNPVDLREDSSTKVHKTHMYKVILPTWYTANTPPDSQPNLPTGQWFPQSGAVTTTPTSSSEASASYSFTATSAVPEAPASPSASATSAAAPTTVVEPTEHMENPTPTAASTAAMEINSELTADDTPAATPLA